MREAVIVSAVRTPLGSFNGALATMGATKLGALSLKRLFAGQALPRKR